MGKGTGAKLVKTETFNVSPSFKSNLAKVFGLDEKKIPDTLELPSTKKIPGLKPKKKGGDWIDAEPVSYTHLTLPTNREV